MGGTLVTRAMLSSGCSGEARCNSRAAGVQVKRVVVLNERRFDERTITLSGGIPVTRVVLSNGRSFGDARFDLNERRFDEAHCTPERATFR